MKEKIVMILSTGRNYSILRSLFNFLIVKYVIIALRMLSIISEN